jgi:ring-1,2-phenylacetyl-CoA epoxidase subunit PaaD
MVSERRIDIVPAAHAARLAVRRASADEPLWALLDSVMDPEVPALSLWELGVLQDIRRGPDGVVVIVTPTYSGCPAMHAMEEAVRQRLAEAGHNDVTIARRLSPAWTTDWMSNEARGALREYGIAPPGATNSPDATHCPQCGSARTTPISEFGSTACKALYRCEDCGEPFDYFKPH